ncbi:MAG: TIGR03619 family F420-dependent LLM class oxidoreductase [Nitrososphaerales archaeon]
MKIGVCVPNFGSFASPSAIKAAAEAAEDLGFDSIWVTDHLVVPIENRIPYGTTYEVISTLSYLASITKKIKVGISALILPLRNPVVVAKQAATIDQLSGGRLILSVGFGWLEKEFSYLKADYKHRYTTVKNGVKLMRALWAEDPVNYFDTNYSIVNALADPKPVQKTAIPIYIAGNTQKALEIALTIGDGWHPVGLSPEEVSQKLETVRRERADFPITLRSPFKLGERLDYRGASGRAMYTIQGSDKEISESLSRFHKNGVSHIVLHIISDSFDEYIKTLKYISVKIIPIFRS